MNRQTLLDEIGQHTQSAREAGQVFDSYVVNSELYGQVKYLFYRMSLNNPQVDEYRTELVDAFKNASEERPRLKKKEILEYIAEKCETKPTESIYRQIIKEFAKHDKARWVLKAG